MTTQVTVWDDDADPGPSSGDVWLWRRYSGAPEQLSVPRHLEENAERLRAAYIGFVHELGERRLAGERVMDALERHRGLSYWWLTQIAEKSPFKSPRIYCCLRLLALEEMLRERAPESLVLATADGALARSVRRLCGALDIAFRHAPPAVTPAPWTLRRVYGLLPHPLRGAISIARHAWARWSLRRNPLPRWADGDDATLMISYFVHLDAERCAAGTFHSHQWGALPELLRDSGSALNWLHHFFFSPAVPDTATGLAWVARFNRDAERQGRHSFADSYLGAGVLFRAFADWVWLMARAWRLRRRGVREAFFAKGSAAWLWPLLELDWKTSTSGPVAVGNCLWVALFDRALATMPPQKRGFYLYESQAWERAMLHAWRKHGHGEIVGVQHATVPFWHLYYFDDARSWRQAGRCPMPLPDRVAVNGPAPLEAFEAAGFPAERLVPVEAVRYLRLERVPPARGGRDGRAPRVLILGDMIQGATREFLRLIEAAVPLLPPGTELTFKPHPAYSPPLSETPRLRVTVTAEPLDAIIGDFDVALSANSTSAACDAFVAGRPVAVMLDGTTLNLSPLRGQRGGVRFFGSPEELAAAVAAGSDGESQAEPELFYLDRQLPRWRQLLQPRERGVLHPTSTP